MHDILAIANSLWTMYADMMKQNPVIGGAFTLYGMGVFTYVFKSVPSRILAYIKNQLTVTVAIHNNNELFYHANNWLADGDKIFRCKSFTATVSNGRRSRYVGDPDDDDDDTPAKEKVIKITVGNGNHLFFYKRRPFWLSRVEKEVNNTTDRKESLFISTVGWYPDPIKNFLFNVAPKPKRETETSVYNFANDYWYAQVAKPKRNMDSVVLTEENAKKIRDHIGQYLASREWYKKHKIPWRTGIILEGPPGTGKSTLSLALCGEFNCDLYMASLALMTDEKLGSMFKSLPPKAVMLVEDIDSFLIATTRKQQKVSKAQKALQDADEDSEGSDDDPKSLFGSLSGLLNAIDGICSTEDRILVATTNHIDRLDPALIRPGRFELILRIDNMNNETAKKMFEKFYPNFKLPDNFNVKPGISPAAFQTMAIGNKENPQALIDFCCQESEENDQENT